MAKNLNISTKHLQIKKASSTVFAVVAVAAVIVSFCVVLLNILWGSSKYNTRVHSAQEEVRDVLTQNLEVVPDLQESYKNLEIGGEVISNQPADKQNSEVVLDALPSKFDFPALVSSINNLAETTSVKLKSFQGTDVGESAVQKTNEPEPVEIPFTIEVEGSYDAIKKFLKGVEDSIRPVHVSIVDISGSDKNLRVNVTAATYYQPAFDLELKSVEVQ